MAKYSIEDTTLTNIANAIRTKTGETVSIQVADMANEIAGIQSGTDTSDATATSDEIFSGKTAYTADGKVTGTFTIEEELTEQNDLISQISTLVAQKANPSGGTDTSDATATAGDILSGKTAYVDGEKVTGTIATRTSSNLTTSGATVTVPAGYYASQAAKSVSTVTQATPSVSINSSGLITASATQSAGYVSAGTKSGTKQMTTKSATTYTPTTSNQTIASGTYLTGAQTIEGDANLVPENIVEGVKIFGVTGTHSGGSSGGGVELCSLSSRPGDKVSFAYISTDNNGDIVTKTATDTYSLMGVTAVCGSCVVIYNSPVDYTKSDSILFHNPGCELIFVGNGILVAKITAGGGEMAYLNADLM